MLHFDTDYMEGCHPKLMQRLVETNLEQTVVRFVTGWATKDKDVDALIEAL